MGSNQKSTRAKAVKPNNEVKRMKKPFDGPMTEPSKDKKPPYLKQSSAEKRYSNEKEFNTVNDK
jgi:ribosomal protein S10